MTGRWVVLVRYYVERLGAGGVVGIALIAGCAAFYVSAVLPAYEQRDALRLRLEAATSRLDRLKVASAAPADTPELKLDKFMRYFPSLAEAPRQVLEIYAAAEKNHLKLENGEYRLIDDAGPRLQRYEIRLPVKGPYVRIRGFLLDALAQIPGMTLDAISIKRETIGAANVEARIQFSVFLAQAR